MIKDLFFAAVLLTAVVVTLVNWWELLVGTPAPRDEWKPATDCSDEQESDGAVDVEGWIDDVAERVVK